MHVYLVDVPLLNNRHNLDEVAMRLRSDLCTLTHLNV